ncbi:MULTISPECIES: DNA-3-methyladenine glycosylase 2 family protein [unclassified Streptomyces]|uniref:DNA-3-methyladenine glycosylase family protein n=1 Tax=unclassified Streptomyces TaxID=2593676 RepID=UPI002DD9E2DF|nr:MULTISPECIES: DNA-3-methyladenine glycosylase 2 family protein [unclassified Streptomyces]WSA94358.1 DNA-3-methyladenine glycosylase 2 family protein [Streptomyces sp. NBC_01795]WSS13020.1 DNA-3-methyladenine glycosylase 2 family protein [Streptomyces sp. NBC_01186]WSS41804.1 DNA-3-methyladenine glycosylase 2 family protein [Streptomyces sp. NBC_01187]
MSLTRSWTPPGPYDLRRSLGVLRRGPYDPTFRAEDGTLWRGTRTPLGPATLRLFARAGGQVCAEAWGPGAEWVLDGLPALLGAEDDPGAFVPHHELTREAHRRHPGLRLIRTGRVLESLIPSVLEQKITAEEAYRAWRLLVRRFGDRAPGPHPGLWVMPAPRDWLRVPSWEWHRAGVDQKRSAAIIRAVQRTGRMEEAARMDLPAALARLQAIPGIGPWTAAEALQRSNGEPDALTVGDLHLPRQVGHALTGARDTDDEGMLALLAPYEGQRHRASRLILLAGPRMPRRQPRFPVGDIARL